MKGFDALRRTWSLYSPAKRKNILVILACLGLAIVFFVATKLTKKPAAPIDTGTESQLIAAPKKNIDLESLNATVTAQSRQLNDLLGRLSTLQTDQRTSAAQLAQQIADVAQGKSADANLQKHIDTEVAASVRDALAKQSKQAPMGTPGTPGMPGLPGAGLNPPLGDASMNYPALPLPGASGPDATTVDGDGSGLRVSSDDDTGSAQGAGNGAGKDGKGGSAATIRPSGSPNESSADRATEKDGGAGDQTWLTAGAMITGVLINGADVPTGQAGEKQPTPTLIRVKKDAILPNQFRADIRECFILAGGYASMATERAYMRTERLSCVRNDGGVIETSLDGYITGEDGKVGMRGKLVSKEGAVIARTLAAGFIGAFGKGLGQGLSGQSNGSGFSVSSQQEVSTSQAVKQGVGAGISDAFGKVEDFYLDIAKQMVPIVEIDAGRAADIILVHGVSLKFSQQR